MNANMKRRFVFCLGAMLFAGTLAAQTPVPEWQAGVDKVKSLIKANPEQASDAAGELLKGKNKKNVELVTSVARAYLDAGQLKEAETYLEMARKADNKAPAVSVLEGDIAFARNDIGKACQLYEQAIYFDSNYKDAYLKYAQAYKSASPSQAIEKLNQLKAIAPDCLEADKELAEVYYATNRFGKAADTYAKFIDTPVATEDDILKYAFALFLNHDFEKSLALISCWRAILMNSCSCLGALLMRLSYLRDCRSMLLRVICRPFKTLFTVVFTLWRMASIPVFRLMMAGLLSEEVRSRRLRSTMRLLYLSMAEVRFMSLSPTLAGMISSLFAGLLM